MPDIIHLLKDHIVNQIAAGEVIQRPASVVKELMDNAIDSGATDIKLFIREAGKVLIQINDNGCGMSPTDARMSFERHATSKINTAEDLFHIQSKGFRGEALASIAAVAQVELRTKPAADATGTKILISDSKIKSLEPCACPTGTQIQVRNLFYNLPARRKFLKNDSIESRHIHEEFIYQAISYPELSFSFFNNDQLVYQLAAGSLKQRILGIYGKKYQDFLIPVSPQTDVVEISGFIGKPELSKKAKGEQILFVNRRFIRSAYLQHAVKAAFENIIPAENLPFYILFLNIDPTQIDINVHPTKHEIKFEDERLIYQFLKAAVRFSLAQHSLTPQIDFDSSDVGIRKIMDGPDFGFGNRSPMQSSSSYASWEQLSPQGNLSGISQDNYSSEINKDLSFSTMVQPSAEDVPESIKIVQFHACYLLVQLKSGISIIDQQLAHERVLYEYYKLLLKSENRQTQGLLFPQNLHLSTVDAQQLKELLPYLQKLGFDMEDFGSDSFVIHGIPALLEGKYNEHELILTILNQYKANLEFELALEENIARSMAISSSIKRGKNLSQEEMQALVEQLFLCEIPYASPSGKKCIFHLSLEELFKKFR
ncbi:MAG: DNA mismatch repair endonuclease MutL [Saprospiraceae bacterium]|nr:DNA mismatch repair endonuclease MutL [Saprospiraceae bacterium]MBK8297743.1 DNA mismatch repair endonuclease MutL [Saprospiraceae bacterium]